MGFAIALAGDVRRGATARLIHPEAPEAGLAHAQAGAGKHSEGSGDHRHLIREDVAEEVLGQDHIESPGS